MTVVTILMAGPLMKYYLGKENAASAAAKDKTEPHITIIPQSEAIIAKTGST